MGVVDYTPMTASERAALDFQREAQIWKSAWRWMLVVTVLSNAGWAWAWWVYR